MKQNAQKKPVYTCPQKGYLPIFDRSKLNEVPMKLIVAQAQE